MSKTAGNAHRSFPVIDKPRCQSVLSFGKFADEAEFVIRYFRGRSECQLPYHYC